MPIAALARRSADDVNSACEFDERRKLCGYLWGSCRAVPRGREPSMSSFVLTSPGLVGFAVWDIDRSGAHRSPLPTDETPAWDEAVAGESGSLPQVSADTRRAVRAGHRAGDSAPTGPTQQPTRATPRPARSQLLFAAVPKLGPVAAHAQEDRKSPAIPSGQTTAVRSQRCHLSY